MSWQLDPFRSKRQSIFKDTEDFEDASAQLV